MVGKVCWPHLAVESSAVLCCLLHVRLLVRQIAFDDTIRNFTLQIMNLFNVCI